MSTPRTILLKITGEILLSSDKSDLSSQMIISIAHQIQQLHCRYRFGIVIGGGNFFRGSKHGRQLGLTASVGHQIGMLATMMNGLIIKDLFEQHGVNCKLFCAVPSAEIGAPISQQAIKASLSKGQCPIFTGGTGNPFFTTDTTAILRGLQIRADEVWKGTSVNGVYNKDPRKHSDAQLIKNISYREALDKNLGIMDATAFAMAKTYKLPIRVFDIFSPEALVNVANNADIGSTIS